MILVIRPLPSCSSGCKTLGETGSKFSPESIASLRVPYQYGSLGYSQGQKPPGDKLPPWLSPSDVIGSRKDLAIPIAWQYGYHRTAPNWITQAPEEVGFGLILHSDYGGGLQSNRSCHTSSRTHPADA
jgi:hypothetical protein